MPGIAMKIRKQLDDHRARNIAEWRRWAEELATNGTSPRPMDVLAVAAALEISDPGETLERDAAAFREYLSQKAAAQFCAADREQKIAAFGGMNKLLAALQRAEAEVSRLREVMADVSQNSSEGFWLSAMSRTQREHPRLWGSWPRRRVSAEEMEVCDDD